jgi:OOP family OmpA-OmpF porin
MFRLNSRGCVFVALSLCAGGPVLAQSVPDDKGFYTGAIAGAAAYPSNPVLEVGQYTFHSIDTREDDMSWGFTGGYRFGRYFAIEAGYVDLGEGTARMVESSGAPVTTDLHLSARGATLAAVVMFPMRKWEPYLKTGLLFADVDLRLNGTERGIPFSLHGSSSGKARAFVETGVSYRFSGKWKATLGLTFFPNVGNENRTGEVDIRSTFLGVTYQF